MQIEWVRIEEAIPTGDTVLEVRVGKKRLTFVQNSGKKYVFQFKCPHAGGVLAGGWCEHGKLICPIHRYSYDLETGRGAAGQGDYIHKYDVEEREDGLYIAIKVPLWKKFFRMT